MGRSKQTTTQEAKIPEWATAANKNILNRAEQTSRVPFAPYFGPDVAAMTPMEIAAMQGTNQMASAFGAPTVDVMAGMPDAQSYGGMMAYSSAPMYEAALAELQRRQPGTYNAIMSQFVDPITGKMEGSSIQRPLTGFSGRTAPVAAPKPAGLIDHNRGR